MIEKNIKTIQWIMWDKKLVRFSENEKSNDISDEVIKKYDPKKFPISKNDKVEIALEGSVVTFIRKVKSDEKVSEEAKKETVEENNTEDNTQEPEVVSDDKKTEIVEQVIFCVSRNKEVVKFDKDGGWIHVDPLLQKKNYSEIGLSAGSKTKLELTNGVITNVLEKFDVVDKTTKEEPRKVSKKCSSYAVSYAKDLAIAALQAGAIDSPDKMEDVLRRFSNVCEELMS